MKTDHLTICLLTGTPTAEARRLCEELAQQGISAIVNVKSEPAANATNEQIRQLTGQPGQDLFFNGWTLLF